MVIEHPARQRRFGSFLNPLVDQCRDFSPQIGGVVEAGELKALQGGARSSSQVIHGWDQT